MPGIESVKEGVDIYHSFPEYEKNEKIYGVIALKLKIIWFNYNLDEIKKLNKCKYIIYFKKNGIKKRFSYIIDR